MLFKFTAAVTLFMGFVVGAPSFGATYNPDDHMRTKVGSVSTRDQLKAIDVDRLSQLYGHATGEWFLIDLETSEYWDILDPARSELEADLSASSEELSKFASNGGDIDIDALWKEAVLNRDAQRATDELSAREYQNLRRCIPRGCFAAYNCPRPPCWGCPYSYRGGIFGTCF